MEDEKLAEADGVEGMEILGFDELDADSEVLSSFLIGESALRCTELVKKLDTRMIVIQVDSMFTEYASATE